MLPELEKLNIIPEQKFLFTHKHGTPEQCIVFYIRDGLGNDKYCSRIVLDIQQVFDKIWRTGLYYKLKKQFPTHFYPILKSYLGSREYYVKVNIELLEIYNVQADVPQGNVLE